MSAPAARRDLPVAATYHAREQAVARFSEEPGFKPARMIDEVRSALADGRYSHIRPVELFPKDRPDTFYCWTPTRHRFYAIRATHDAYLIVTVMDPSSDERDDA